VAGKRSKAGDCFELQHVMLCSAWHDRGNPVWICSLFSSRLAYFKKGRAAELSSGCSNGEHKWLSISKLTGCLGS
jgi:hypothetical protein